MYKTLLKFEKKSFLLIRTQLILLSLAALTFEFLLEVSAKMFVVPSLIIGIFIIVFVTLINNKFYTKTKWFSNYRRILITPLLVALTAEALPEVSAKMFVVPSLTLVLFLCSIDIMKKQK